MAPLLWKQGARVMAGEVLVEKTNRGSTPVPATAGAGRRAGASPAERLTDPSAELTAMELAQARDRLATQTDRARRLIVRSQGEGACLQC
jgi:hypothetical protein